MFYHFIILLHILHLYYYWLTCPAVYNVIRISPTFTCYSNITHECINNHNPAVIYIILKWAHSSQWILLFLVLLLFWSYLKIWVLLPHWPAHSKAIRDKMLQILHTKFSCVWSTLPALSSGLRMSKIWFHW